eukprot:IDg21273t1
MREKRVGRVFQDQLRGQQRCVSTQHDRGKAQESAEHIRG